MTSPTKIICPLCRGESEWSNHNPYRPFCSARCRLIDLGEWVAGERVMTSSPVLDVEQYE